MDIVQNNIHVGECQMSVLNSNETLKELINQYPTYPIVVLVNEEVVYDYGYSTWYAPEVYCYVGEILENQDINDERIFSDRDEFEEELADAYCDLDEFKNLTDEEFHDIILEKVKEYDPYWKDCIIIYATV